MLTAMRILVDGKSSDAGYNRQLVFLAVAGDAWGNMGSKRFLWEMEREQREWWTPGLNMSDIDQIIELGSVGAAYSKEEAYSKFLLHMQVGEPVAC